MVIGLALLWLFAASPVLPPDARAAITADPIPFDRADPAVRHIGRLRWLGGWHLRGEHPAFGGISSMLVQGDHFILLSDTGMVTRFRFDGRTVRDPFLEPLPAAPGDVVDKRGRDSESMTRGRDDRIWIGFEYRNQIWRYSPDLERGEAHTAPPAMAHWGQNSGPEAMVALPDGRFVVLSERSGVPGQAEGTNEAMLFDRDPARPDARSALFTYRPPKDHVPTDAVLLPDGDLLVLHRGASMIGGLSAVLSIVKTVDIVAAATVEGQEIARLAPPLSIDNMEALAIAHDGDRTILWIASDDNFSPVQRTLLMKFALDPAQEPDPPARSGAGLSSAIVPVRNACQRKAIARSRQWFRRRRWPPASS